VTRVLIIVQNLPVPFDRRVWLESQALRDAGYQVTVVCPKDDGDPPHQVIDGIEIYKYRPYAPGGSKAGFILEYLYSFLATARLVRRARRAGGRFAVLQACNPPDIFWPIALALRARDRTRFVFDHHDLCPELYVARFGDKRSGDFLHRALLAMERAQFATADLVISTNESYRQVAIRRGHVPPDRVVVVRSGPSRERFATVRPVDPQLKRGRPYLVAYLGVMAPQDGVDHLLRAAAHLKRLRAPDDVAYTLIGAGDSFDDLRALSHELGLDGDVQFTGRIPDPDVERILATADVCVCPDPRNPLNDVSTMNKILEYMACGRPIVAYDLREHRYSAADGALYAEPNREEDLAARVSELLDDPARRATMGAYNRERFLNQMAWEYSAGELLKAYGRLCGTTNPE
jgi:glycosyltransferase involved in cell wall biosynthesis